MQNLRSNSRFQLLRIRRVVCYDRHRRKSQIREPLCGMLLDGLRWRIRYSTAFLILALTFASSNASINASFIVAFSFVPST